MSKCNSCRRYRKHQAENNKDPEPAWLYLGLTSMSFRTYSPEVASQMCTLCRSAQMKWAELELYSAAGGTKNSCSIIGKKKRTCMRCREACLEGRSSRPENYSHAQAKHCVYCLFRVLFIFVYRAPPTFLIFRAA